jgi:hypothetical protein
MTTASNILGNMGVGEARQAAIKHGQVQSEQAVRHNDLLEEQFKHVVEQTDMKDKGNVTKVILNSPYKKRVNKIDPDTGALLGFEDVPDVETAAKVVKAMGYEVPDEVFKAFQPPPVVAKPLPKKGEERIASDGTKAIFDGTRWVKK